MNVALIDFTQFINEQRQWLFCYFKEGESHEDKFYDLVQRGRDLRQNSFSEANELVELYHRIICHLSDLEYSSDFLTLNSDSRDMFSKDYFLWTPLPYPRYHAELAALLFLFAKISDREELIINAEKLVQWQITTLDHNALPIFSLWSQEKGSNYECLLAHIFLFGMGARYAQDELLRKNCAAICSRQQNYLFNLDAPEECSIFSELVNGFNFDFISDEPFLDPNIQDLQGSFFLDRKNFTFYCTGKGCKSGLGAFYGDELGLVNFGPQRLPLGDCQSFGILDLLESRCQNNDYFFCSPIAFSNDRPVFFSDLQDASFSGLWQEIRLQKEEKKLKIQVKIKGIFPNDQVAFVFFIKAEECFVSKSQKLRPKSLDRYRGPSYPLEIRAARQSMSIFAAKPTQMEIIPLSGGQNFWGANFLAAYFFKNGELAWDIELLS